MATHKVFGFEDVEIFFGRKRIKGVKSIEFDTAEKSQPAIIPQFRGSAHMTISDPAEFEKFKNVMDAALEQHTRELVKRKDEIICKALKDKGFDPTDKGWLKKHFSRVSIEDAPDFEHWYVDFFNPDTRTRIISISKPIYSDPDTSEDGRSAYQEISYRYY